MNIYTSGATNLSFNLSINQCRHVYYKDLGDALNLKYVRIVDPRGRFTGIDFLFLHTLGFYLDKYGAKRVAEEEEIVIYMYR